jgi:hypothetical protein
LNPIPFFKIVFIRLKFTGTGDGATAILRTPEIIQDEYEFQMGILQILSGGKGFAEEPILEVLRRS